MNPVSAFLGDLEAKVAQQLKSQRVGYLLGAGSSFLGNAGYPLADQLWDLIRDSISDPNKRNDIQAKLNSGAQGIEHALDLLDEGGAADTPYRHLVVSALADLFMQRNPPLDLHAEFVRRIALRPEPCIKVFSLNYDPLIERAAERARVRLLDGFLGHEHAFFNAAVFSESFLVNRGPRVKPTMHPAGVPVHLYKLHGSLGWYECPIYGSRRCAFASAPPTGLSRLMVPPQRRKASDVIKSPYSPLWTAFRGAMSHDPRPGDEDVLIGQIGSYVAIRQNDVNIIAIVTRMTEQESLAAPNVEMPGDEAARLPFAKRIARLTPIGRIRHDGLFDRGVGRYPTTGAEVHAIGSRDISKMFERYQGKGLSVGVVAAHPSLKVFLDPTNLFGRHFAILGQTGSGKSWAVASLVQRAVEVMPRAHIIILDLHGEYCWREDGKRRYAFADAMVRHVDARELEIPYWLMTYAELCDLLIDHTDHSAHNQTAVFREVLGPLRLSEGKRLGLVRTTLDTPVHFDLMELRGEVEARNGMVPSESTGKLIRGPLTGAFDNFLMRLDSKINDVRYDFLLKPKVRRDSASLSSLLRDFVGLGTPRAAVTLIDLSSVPFDVRPTVAAQIGRLAFEFNYWNPQYREFPILLVCEEAHAYIPRLSESQFAGSRKSMERIAKEGRKYGVGLAVVSQRPHEVSETVLAQCGTFICLRITNPDDQSYVRSLVPESEGDLTSVLAGLGRGEALVLGEAVPLPTRLQFERPNPTPNSDDIDFHDRWKHGPADLDVEAIVERWRSQER